MIIFFMSQTRSAYNRKNQQSGVRASVEGVEADGVRTCSVVDHRLLSYFDQSVVCVDR